MKTIIYCRVSTDAQEREGSSLGSQLKACLEYNQQKDGPEPVQILETYSGLTMERPKLTEIRQMIERNEVDAIICYCPDRLSRVGEHLLQLMNECNEKAIKLRFVREDWSSFDPGVAKLMAFMYGWSSEQEAKKILERTSRGKRSRALSGKLPSGGYCLYGYVYSKESGRYLVNEYEAQTVKNIFNWIVKDQLSMRQICRKLTAANITAPRGGSSWGRSTIARILKNTEYYGSTFAYKTIGTRGKKRMQRNKSEWVELPDVTPAIITKELFDSAQEQLTENKHAGPTNHKYEYLLKGMVYCSKCGRRYSGVPSHGRRYYRCSSNDSLSERCGNKSVVADDLEDDIWDWIKVNVLDDSDKAIERINNRIESGDQLRHWQAEIDIKQERIKRIRKQIEQAERLFIISEDDSEKNLLETASKIKKIKAEIPPIEKEIEDLQVKLDSNKKMIVNRDRLKEYLDELSKDTDNLPFEKKRLLLKILNIKVNVGDIIAVDGLVRSCPQYSKVVGQSTESQTIPFSFVLLR